MAATATPARRVKARRLPTVAIPPKSSRANRNTALGGLELTISGRPYLIGPSVEGDPETAATIDGVATVTIAVRDPDATLEALLGDQDSLLNDGVSATINGDRYMLQSASADGTGLVTVVMEDEVKWRLSQFDRFLAVRRTRTRFFPWFARRLVKEASDPPLASMGFYCPELDDKQQIKRPSTSSTVGQAGRASGLGSQAITVKGKPASALQRDVIEGCLAQAQQDGASRRVMIAVVMAITQESDAGVLANVTTGNDDTGIYQQGRNWISVAGARQPGPSTHAFLVTGPSSWKKVHGSTKTAPADLETAIKQVQISVGGYRQWEGEATNTVNVWLGSDSAKTITSTVVEPFEYTRGEKHGDRENSWDALGRYATDIGYHRWAQHNTLLVVSDDELRAAAPSAEVHGDEGWLLQAPAWEWNPRRATHEVTMRVLADRWGMQIGAVLNLHRGAAQGRFLVAETSGGLVSPEMDVTLRRPTPKKREPAASTKEVTKTISGGGGGVTRAAGANSDLLSVCRAISAQGRAYLYGGGHGKALSRITPTERLDCSSSVSLALWLAGMFPGSVAITSGEFAASWGRPGRGREFTVYANAEHVFIWFEHSSQYKRFDTSPWGSGESGPRVRTGGRSLSGFTPRHWPGH